MCPISCLLIEIDTSGGLLCFLFFLIYFHGKNTAHLCLYYIEAYSMLILTCIVLILYLYKPLLIFPFSNDQINSFI